MNTLELKSNLHRLVVETEDPVVLQEITALFVSLLKIKRPDTAFVKQYEANLKPMTREDLIRRAMEAEEDIRNGKVSDLAAYLESIEAGA